MNIIEAYQVLELKPYPVPSFSEINRACRNITIAYHPDKHVLQSQKKINEFRLKFEQVTLARDYLIQQKDYMLTNIDLYVNDNEELTDDYKEKFYDIVAQNSENFNRAFTIFLENPNVLPQGLESYVRYNRKTGLWNLTGNKIDLTKITTSHERLKMLMWLFVMLDGDRLSLNEQFIFNTEQLELSCLEEFLMHCIKQDYSLSYMQTQLGLDASRLLKSIIENIIYITFGLVAGIIAVNTGGFSLFAFNFTVIQVSINILLSLADTLCEKIISENKYKALKSLKEFIFNIDIILYNAVFSLVYGPQLWMLAYIPEVTVKLCKSLYGLIHGTDKPVNYKNLIDILLSKEKINIELFTDNIKNKLTQFVDLLVAEQEPAVVDATHTRTPVTLLRAARVGFPNSVERGEALVSELFSNTGRKLIKWH